MKQMSGTLHQCVPDVTQFDRLEFFQCHQQHLLMPDFIRLVLLLSSSILAAPGESESCPKICSAEYAPVCAGPAGSHDNKQTKTFGNLCAMQIYNCEHNERQYLYLLLNKFV